MYQKNTIIIIHHIDIEHLNKITIYYYAITMLLSPRIYTLLQC